MFANQGLEMVEGQFGGTAFRAVYPHRDFEPDRIENQGLPTAIAFYSAFFTSIWLWLYILAVLVIIGVVVGVVLCCCAGGDGEEKKEDMMEEKMEEEEKKEDDMMMEEEKKDDMEAMME